MSEQITVHQSKMIRTLSQTNSIGMPSAHELIMSLRHSKEINNTIREYLIRLVDKVAYPLKRRTKVSKLNWSENYPLRMTIDSRAKHCNVCGKSAYYIVHENTSLYAWRLCFKHLSISDRHMIEQFYWNSN